MSDRLVRTIVRKFWQTNIPEDDLFQEGMLALLKAERTFNQQMGVKFETYASMVIRNRLIDVIRGDKTGTDEGSEAVGTVVGRPLEDEVALKEMREFLHTVLASCSAVERAIFNAWFQGFSYDEICDIFTITPKKVDNTIQKIKKRLKLNYAN